MLRSDDVVKGGMTVSSSNTQPISPPMRVDYLSEHRYQRSSMGLMRRNLLRSSHFLFYDSCLRAIMGTPGRWSCEFCHLIPSTQIRHFLDYEVLDFTPTTASS